MNVIHFFFIGCVVVVVFLFFFRLSNISVKYFELQFSSSIMTCFCLLPLTLFPLAHLTQKYVVPLNVSSAIFHCCSPWRIQTKKKVLTKNKCCKLNLKASLLCFVNIFLFNARNFCSFISQVCLCLCLALC